MQVRKQQLELDMKQLTGSKWEKEYVKTVDCHPTYLTYMQSTSWETGLDEAQAGIKIVRDFILGGSKITADSDCSHEIKTLAPWKKTHDKPRECIKKQRHHFADKGLSSQSYDFSSSHVGMWELDP